MRLTGPTVSCTLALLLSLAAGVAWPSYSWADAVYTFTFTGDPLSNPGWDANGSFSIPVSDFATSPASVSNGQITAASFTLSAPPGSTSPVLGLGDVLAADSNNFTYVLGVPQVQAGTGGFLVAISATSQACNPNFDNCAWGLEAAFGGTGIVILGPPGVTDMGGTWTTSLQSVGAPGPVAGAGLPGTVLALGAIGLLAGARSGRLRRSPLDRVALLLMRPQA